MQCCVHSVPKDLLYLRGGVWGGGTVDAEIMVTSDENPELSEVLSGSEGVTKME